jgi:hypothetical protein
MNEVAPGRPTLRKKPTREFKEVAALTLYLYICLGAMVIFTSAVLQQAGLGYSWSF